MPLRSTKPFVFKSAVITTSDCHFDVGIRFSHFRDEKRDFANLALRNLRAHLRAKARVFRFPNVHLLAALDW